MLVFLHKAITGVTDEVGNRTYWDWWEIVTKCKNINSKNKQTKTNRDGRTKQSKTLQHLQH